MNLIYWENKTYESRKIFKLLLPYFRAKEASIRMWRCVTSGYLEEPVDGMQNIQEVEGEIVFVFLQAFEMQFLVLRQTVLMPITFL